MKELTSFRVLGRKWKRYYARSGRKGRRHYSRFARGACGAPHWCGKRYRLQENRKTTNGRRASKRLGRTWYGHFFFGAEKPGDLLTQSMMSVL